MLASVAALNAIPHRDRGRRLRDELYVGDAFNVADHPRLASIIKFFELHPVPDAPDGVVYRASVEDAVGQLLIDGFPHYDRGDFAVARELLTAGDADGAEAYFANYRSAYGVAPSLTHVLEHFRDDIEDPTRLFLIAINPQDRKDGKQFRWHKQGPAIGGLNPQREHFGDEPEIEHVVLFHIYQLSPEAVALRTARTAAAL